jgi:hypothetical protein
VTVFLHTGWTATCACAIRSVMPWPPNSALFYSTNIPPRITERKFLNAKRQDSWKQRSTLIYRRFVEKSWRIASYFLHTAKWTSMLKSLWCPQQTPHSASFTTKMLYN